MTEHGDGSGTLGGADGRGSPTAVVLLSGGLDSATCLALAREDGFGVHALTFTYGQRHGKEVARAERIARKTGVLSHVVLDFPMGSLTESSLMDPEAPLRDAVGVGDGGSGGRAAEGVRSGESAGGPEGVPGEAGPGTVPADIPDTVPADISDTVPADIPDTYVPARNMLFLAAGISRAEALGSRAVYIGANAVDYSGYPDCRPDFIEAFARAAELGTRAGVRGSPIEVRAPLIGLSKGRIVREAFRLGVPLELTWSCYAGKERPCRKCDSCRLRARGFREAGMDDPAL